MHKTALRAERAAFDEDERDHRGLVRAVWLRIAPRRPRDMVLAMLAAGAMGAIFINALFLQPGPHPAPIFALRPPPVPPARPAVRSAVSPHEATGAIAVLPRPRPPELQARAEPARPRDVLSDVQRELATRSPAKAKAAAVSASAAPAAPAAPRSEPAAGLVVPARQIVAVQQALGDFGYGQVKPTGVYDPETRAAIETFEGARRLPVTGQITDRLMRELAAMTGRSLN